MLKLLDTRNFENLLMPFERTRTEIVHLKAKLLRTQPISGIHFPWRCNCSPFKLQRLSAWLKFTQFYPKRHTHISFLGCPCPPLYLQLSDDGTFKLITPPSTTAAVAFSSRPGENAAQILSHSCAVGILPHTCSLSPSQFGVCYVCSCDVRVGNIPKKLFPTIFWLTCPYAGKAIQPRRSRCNYPGARF